MPAELTTNTLTSVASHKQKSGTWQEIKKNASIYAFISPFYILFLVFGLFPILFSLYLAFHSWDGIGEMKFVGFRYFSALVQDPDFWTALGNTLIIWFESTVPQLIIALILAFLLNASFVRFKDFFRAVYFLPNITSIVAVAIVFGSFFGTQYGLMNFVLGIFGIHKVDWLGSPYWIKWAVSSMVIWRWAGYNSIIYLSALQNISNDLYEAAELDGASKTQQFFRITVPLLRPTILFTVILSTIGGMQIFTEPQVLTGGNGGTGLGGLTVVLYLYNQAFKNHFYGYASAIAWALFLIIIAFSFLNWKLVSKKEA